MPRARVKPWSPNGSYVRHSLDNTTRRELLDCLGSGDQRGGEALEKVANLLGLYVAIDKSLKDAPKRRGRPKNEVRNQLVGKLRRIYRQYYAGEARNVRGRVGGRILLSENENAEDEFVETSLRAAGISFPRRRSRANIRALYNEPGAWVPGSLKLGSEIVSERDRVIQNIARKIEKKRLRKKLPKPARGRTKKPTRAKAKKQTKTAGGRRITTR